MFYGIKAQIYGDEKNVVSVPHITSLDFGHIIHNAFLNQMVLFR